MITHYYICSVRNILRGKKKKERKVVNKGHLVENCRSKNEQHAAQMGGGGHDTKAGHRQHVKSGESLLLLPCKRPQEILSCDRLVRDMDG